jgi:hypothetical protein
MIQQPALDQQYSTLIDQLSALNAKLNAFINGAATDTVALDNGNTIKTLSGIVADLTRFHYVQKVVDQRLYSDMIAADSTLEVGLLVRVWGDTALINGLYLKQAPGTYQKVSYATLYDLGSV